EYTLGPEDVLNIGVWDRPELSRTVTVQGNGAITFPPIGEVPAAGKTVTALERDLENRLNDFLRRPTQVNVSVAAFNSRYVVVSGAVTTPGRIGFEKMPDLVQVLGTTGGLGAGGDLSRVQIFRENAPAGQSPLTVDVASAMAGGSVTNLPALQAGDVIYVPPIPIAGTGVAGPSGTSVYVSGEVARPGAYGVVPGLDLIRVLSLAGGALPTGDLRHVQVLGQDANGSSYVVVVDVKKGLDEGGTAFPVQAGDAIHVPKPPMTAARATWGATRVLLGASRDLLNFFLISDYIDEHN
ncbi:MAG: polysaccharide biosynthesis/export family protein, partial [Candidatus Eisenbacteria bacterium]|nr:polysaccharide biosynthesis/export family protein [Candidatus Eisenbacteria bacterium]